MVAVPLGARRHLILAVSTSSLEKRLLPIFEIQSFVSRRRLGESFVKLQSKSLLRPVANVLSWPVGLFTSFMVIFEREGF